MDKAKCEGRVYNPNGSWGNKYRQCDRNATGEVEGKHYCGTHNPVAKKARDDKRSEAWNAKWAERDNRLRLERAAPELLKELEHLAACLHSWIESGHSVPGIATLNGAWAAIAKARGES